MGSRQGFMMPDQLLKQQTCGGFDLAALLSSCAKPASLVPVPAMLSLLLLSPVAFASDSPSLSPSLCDALLLQMLQPGQGARMLLERPRDMAW